MATQAKTSTEKTPKKVPVAKKTATADKAVVKAKEQPKLRIKLKSYDVRMLEASLNKIVGLLVKS